jgi:hypothetical protein
MALKLTRRPGESILIKHYPSKHKQSDVRFTLKKIGSDDGGKFVVLQYSSAANFLIESSEQRVLACKADKLYTVKHYVSELFVKVSVSRYRVLSFDWNFGFENVSGNQVRLWFEANQDVKIVRDELEETPLCLS